MRRRLPYPLVGTLLGLMLGWLPRLVHGPIPEKFNVLYIRGAVAVWAFYTARMMIGFWVGGRHGRAPGTCVAPCADSSPCFR